jgi:sugar phosphate isomerase/epimerase
MCTTWHDVARHVTTCMIKDCVVSDGTPDVMVLPGEGLVDFRTVVSGLVAGGFRGPLYVECLGGQELPDINDRARRTHGFLRELLALL